jgi:hypothetical protein
MSRARACHWPPAAHALGNLVEAACSEVVVNAIVLITLFAEHVLALRESLALAGSLAGE